MLSRDIKLNFNGGWSKAEAAHAVSVKLTQKTQTSKKTYSRRVKHKKVDNE